MGLVIGLSAAHRDPTFGGPDLDRIDVVPRRAGPEGFAEYEGSVIRIADGIPLHVLPLERVIASKRATKRPKDLATLPALEATIAARKQRDDQSWLAAHLARRWMSRADILGPQTSHPH